MAAKMALGLKRSPPSLERAHERENGVLPQLVRGEGV